MTERSILLYGNGRPAMRRIASCLRATGSEVHCLNDPAAAQFLIEEGSLDLILVDHDSALDPTAVLEAAEDWVPALTLRSQTDAADLVYTVFAQGVSYLVANVGSDDSPVHTVSEKDLVVAAEKILRGDLFGMRKYLSGYGTEIRSLEVATADDRDAIVGAAETYLRKCGARHTAVATVANITDELVSNALFKAPRDSAGRPRYRGVCRRGKVVLEPGEQVRVELASDGHRVAVSVTDSFGSLHGKYLRAALRQCLANNGSAHETPLEPGLGLRSVFSSCSALVINVEPGVRTEVIAFVDLGRGKDRHHNGRSLQLFVAGRDDCHAAASSVERDESSQSPASPDLYGGDVPRLALGTDAGRSIDTVRHSSDAPTCATAGEISTESYHDEVDEDWELPVSPKVQVEAAAS